MKNYKLITTLCLLILAFGCTKDADLDFILGFNLTVTGNQDLLVNSSDEFNMAIFQENESNRPKYIVTFTQEEGTVGNGTLSLNDESVSYNSPISVDKGITNLSFQGTQAGPVVIKVRVEDNFDNVEEKLVEFNVGNIEFQFTAAPQEIFLNQGDNTDINFLINETGNSGSTYEIKYVIDNGGFTLNNAGDDLTTNTFYDVDLGSFAWTITADEGQDIQITFVARNKETLEEFETTVDIEVLENEFTFTAEPVSPFGITGVATNINFLLDNRGNNGVTFFMTYSTNVDGILEFDGIQYEPNQPIDISNGAFTASYTSYTAGTANIIFTAQNSNSATVSDTVSIDIDSSGDSDGDGISDETDNCISTPNPDQADNDGDGIGDLCDSDDDNDGILDVNDNCVFVANPDQADADADGIGDLCDEAVPYTFTVNAAAQESNIYKNELTDLLLSVLETPRVNETYEVSFNLDAGDNADILQAGTILDENTFYPVADFSNFGFLFRGTQTGVIGINFQVRNSRGDLELASTSLNVLDTDFVFTANPSTTTAAVGQQVNIAFNIANLGVEDLTYTMTFTSDIDGVLLVDGIQYLPGASIPMSEGPTSGSYVGNEIGNSDLFFEVQANNGIIHSRNLDIIFN